MRENVIELGCEQGYEDFRNSVLWLRAGVVHLKKRFGGSLEPFAGGLFLQRRGSMKDRIISYTHHMSVLLYGEAWFCLLGVGGRVFILLHYTRYQPPSLRSGMIYDYNSASRRVFCMYRSIQFRTIEYKGRKTLVIHCIIFNKTGPI